MRVLVLQSAKLGDMVCTTPVFCALKNAGAYVAVMGGALNGELLAGHPCVDEYIVEPKQSADILRLLKEKKFDAAVCTSPNPNVLWLMLRARIPKIVVPKIVGGYSPYQTKLYRLLSHFVTRVEFHFGAYMPREYLKLLEPLGINSDDTRKELAVDQSVVVRMRELLPKGDGPLVGISPSAGNPVKGWQIERFAAVAAYLYQKHAARLVLVGGQGDVPKARALRDAMPDTPVFDFVGKTSVEELKALMSLLNLFVASDTGPIYIAEAFDIPLVDIAGPVAHTEQPPRGPTARVVYSKEFAEPAMHILSAAVYDPEEVRKQSDAVTVEMVIQAVEEVIG